MNNIKLVNKQQNNKRKKTALMFTLPLVASLLLFFITPITYILYKGFYNDDVVSVLPRTIKSLSTWDYKNSTTPDEKSYIYLIIELQSLAKHRLTGKLTKQLNRIVPNSSRAVKRAVRKIAKTNIADIKNYKQFLIAVDPIWAKADIWRGIKHYSSSFRLDNYANALDYKVNINGGYSKNPVQERSYVPILIRTLWIASLITILCFLLAYPVAYFIAHQTTKVANILLLFVLLPFWTSFLVRITSWIAILQTNGVINNLLSYLDIINKPLDILYNQFATVIAMVHILLPFMILPLYSVMKGIDGTYIKASKSLGANNIESFLRIYLPLSLPGAAAGGLLVFIISLGYYVTPALLGGIDGQLISNIIAFHMSKTGNWGLAAALSGILFIVVVFLYIIYDKLVGIKHLKL